jgi:peptidoglycan/LPS O-acetylase OafA/YrhL
MQGRDNSFDFARFIAATGVIFSHHFPIFGKVEPRFLGVTLGTVAVSVFFTMSGYLIYSSISRNSEFFRFVSARILRIFPSLFFIIIISSVFTMLWYNNSENFVDHMRYVAQNILMLVRGHVRYEISGVFGDRPMHAINGSLWTLPYEVWCYFILFGLLAMLPKFRLAAIAAALAISCVLWGFVDLRLKGTGINFSRLGSLGFWFFGGALFAAASRKLPLLSSPSMAWFSKGGDPSYGMYVFAWPVQQYCAMLIGNFWLSMLTAFCVTTLAGYASWHGFERRALARTNALAAWLSSKSPIKSPA